MITIPYGDSMSAGAQTAQTFQLTCSLTGALGDDKTARPGASAKVRVQMETGCIAKGGTGKLDCSMAPNSDAAENCRLERWVI